MPKRSFEPGDFNLAVRRSRAGLGLFAAGPIPAEACVIEYTGPILTDRQVEASNSRYLFEIRANKTIDGSPRANRARYVNHSCDPNCETEIRKNRVYIFALRDIEPGEELSYDYGKEYFDAYIGDKCRCLKCMPVYPPPARVAAEPKPEASEPADAPTEQQSAAA
jgi:hypothetical protein